MTKEENASMANSHSSNGPIQNLSYDSSNCYYLHPSDNPGALLVSEIFTVLSITNDPHLRVAWLRANNLVLSWANEFNCQRNLCEFKALWDEYISYRPIPQLQMWEP
ncbi:hypothetical protein CK203_056518 [Vitis vinifera]|uniref:Uncharacterized protein n=1 Tax=Vitis vinifera TaxID=29760 RepID=A0A438GEJ3_VITVI|nr:hypothetical protein CK203_056518 [Vitis vinifera]